MTAHLFTPISLRDITLRNRIMVSPMQQFAARDGMASTWHLVHLASRAVGGAAVVCAEMTAVEARGRASLADLGLWADEHVDALHPIAAAIAEHGAVPAIQLGHAGRKASMRIPFEARGPLTKEEGGWQPVGASSTPAGPEHPQPQTLTVSEIATVVAAFAAAARRAHQAGFRLLEIHGGHGYLVHQFLSPLCNDRTDQYGGDVARRAQFLFDVIEAIRASWPATLPLVLRLSLRDRAPAGWTLDDSIWLARRVRELGVDLIDCSNLGGIGPGPADAGVSHHAGDAATVRVSANIAVASVGGIVSAHQADHIIRSGQADCVAIAREMLRDPYWAARAAQVLGHPVPMTPRYARAWA